MRTIFGILATLIVSISLLAAQNTTQTTNDPNRAGDQSMARTTNDAPSDHRTDWGWIGLLGLAGLGGLAGRNRREDVRDRNTTDFRRAA
ncbi:MAG TPA: WGxxGxxG family protein [Terriglobales bacterium]|jgi:MYXO-CTERM domain-containing protein|nr:WGxxGxxG family protein [Terriglobales bacterium]